MTMVKKSKEINILRGIAFFLVLLGHSFPDSSYGFVNSYSQFANKYIYSFHMPLFFMISGFCLRGYIVGDCNRVEQVRKRFKRLVIPYLFYSYIAILPKLVFNKYMYLPFEKKQVFEIWVGKSPSGTLWYVWNLFMITVLFLICGKYIKNEYLLAVIGIALYLCYVVHPDGYFSRFYEYAVWFTLGLLLSRNFFAVMEIVKKWGGYWNDGRAVADSSNYLCVS